MDNPLKNASFTYGEYEEWKAHQADVAEAVKRMQFLMYHAAREWNVSYDSVRTPPDTTQRGDKRNSDHD